MLEQFKNYINKQSLRNELTCITGDFNIAPEDKDVHNPEIYKERIMASKLERQMLNDIIFGKFTDSSESLRIMQDFGVGGITVIMHTI